MNLSIPPHAVNLDTNEVGTKQRPPQQMQLNSPSFWCSIRQLELSILKKYFKILNRKVKTKSVSPNFRSKPTNLITKQPQSIFLFFFLQIIQAHFLSKLVTID